MTYQQFILDALKIGTVYKGQIVMHRKTRRDLQVEARKKFGGDYKRASFDAALSVLTRDKRIKSDKQGFYKPGKNCV